MPGKPFWLPPWSMGLLSSGASRHPSKEPALLPCTSPAELEGCQGSWWLLALRSAHLSGP